MTKNEALIALANAKKITHRFFTPEEWMIQIHSDLYAFEDGCKCTPSRFWGSRSDEVWDDGWSIFDK